MEIFMRGLDWNVNKYQVQSELERVLHSPPLVALFGPSQTRNFHVHLHQDKRRVRHHAGTGTLTLPNADIGNRFLQLHGSDRPQKPLFIGKKMALFYPSKQPEGRPDVVQQIILQPYEQPWVTQERDRQAEELKESVPLRAIQFAWECRDYTLSIECEHSCAGRAALRFDQDRREIRVQLEHERSYLIVAPYSYINNIHIHNYLGQEPAIVFILNTPLAFEYKPELELTSFDRFFLGIATDPPRQRISFLPIPGHKNVAPFASLVLRLICSTTDALAVFRKLCREAQLHRVDDYEYPIDRRGRFSTDALERLRRYVDCVEWCVAFQVEALLRNLYLDALEIIDILPNIQAMLEKEGPKFTAMTLRHFGNLAKHLFWDEGEDPPDILRCLQQAQRETRSLNRLGTLKPSDGSLCDILHVKITPTTMSLDGPVPEQSNRVIRSYDPSHQESFLRVTFTDEGGLQYRFDRDVDGPAFIRRRLGPFMLEGLTIAGRRFEFLAYSQSALKEHSVWFVKPFKNGANEVNAGSIIAGLGTFDKVDRRLMYCPARYAARISQAFTATDAVQVDVEEIFRIDDISTTDGKYTFTDGVGTMSPALAGEIWIKLRSSKRRRGTSPPSSYQIRFQGSKGMLSVDYKLSGYSMCLRPSMIKFEDPNTTAIEIARAFDRPTPYFLNRPLIMLLEGLGVPYETFKKYQDIAVRATKDAAKSLKHAARLLESHGLGSSYRLPSIILSIDKLHVSSLPNNQFYEKMLAYGINHVLRDLKNHARIPIPNAWTLVGVADVHKFLRPKEIFACVKPVNSKTIYLEGPILISRSPTIHPGDVTIVHAIGSPPPGSPYSREPLANTVVFSVLGDRPIPSCLGGGDLDGDVYNLVPLNLLPEFLPEKLSAPANYEAVPRKEVSHPSTMKDVAEFVMDYINSDVLGLVAINWLIIADMRNIFDTDCMKLASLHSKAVDYPKSGQPVPLKDIPRLPGRQRPDWNAPETVNVSSSKNYYESHRAIGRLFREIDLSIEQPIHDGRPRRKQKKNKEDSDTGINGLTYAIGKLGLSDLAEAIEGHVDEYIDTEAVADEVESIMDLFTRYTSELRGICVVNSLSRARTAQLSEEEAIIGTIIQKSSQPRKRKDLMASLRSSTDLLARAIREQLQGEESNGPYQELQRAWLAWRLALERGNEFGAQSFGWLALGVIFEAIRDIESTKERDF